jgi:hypothetical protein
MPLWDVSADGHQREDRTGFGALTALLMYDRSHANLKTSGTTPKRAIARSSQRRLEPFPYREAE